RPGGPSSTRSGLRRSPHPNSSACSLERIALASYASLLAVPCCSRFHSGTHFRSTMALERFRQLLSQNKHYSALLAAGTRRMHFLAATFGFRFPERLGRGKAREGPFGLEQQGVDLVGRGPRKTMRFGGALCAAGNQVVVGGNVVEAAERVLQILERVKRLR